MGGTLAGTAPNSPTWMVDGKPGQILALMPRLMKAVGVLPKNRKARGKDYKFRSIDDLLALLQPALIRLGITTAVEVVHHRRDKVGRWQAAEVLVRVSYVAPDGSCVTSTAAGEAADYEDKATNKALTSAIKAAHLHTLQVPTGTQRDIEEWDGRRQWSARAKAVIVQLEDCSSPEEVAAILDGPAISGAPRREREDLRQLAVSRWKQLCSRSQPGGPDDWPEHDFRLEKSP